MTGKVRTWWPSLGAMGHGGCQGEDSGPSRSLFDKVELIELDELLGSGRQVFLGEDGIDRAGGDAGAAVDALARIDVEHPINAVVSDYAIDRADVQAGSVQDVDAGMGYDVGHGESKARAPEPGPVS